MTINSMDPHHTLVLVEAVEELLRVTQNSGETRTAEAGEEIVRRLRENDFSVARMDTEWYVGLDTGDSAADVPFDEYAAV